MDITEDYRVILKWASWVAVIMLLLAVPTFLPYGYYQLLRIFIMVLALMLSAALNTTGSKKAVAFVFLLIAVLFNAFYPIHLEKEVWVIIDIITAIVFGYTAWKWLK